MKPRIVAIPALILLAACGQETTPGSTASPSPSSSPSTSPSASGQRYEVWATVLEHASHGPQLCSMVLTSMPPQCGGPDVVGWTWSAVEHKSLNGTTWGMYDLVGTWDGSRFTLTEPAKPSPPGTREVPEGDFLTPDFTSPCRAAAGDREAVDPSKAGVDDYERALRTAEKDKEFAGGWIDTEGGGTVLVMRFTRDLGGHEREIRRTWGGALCLTTAARSQAELRKVREQAVQKVPDLLGASIDIVDNAVSIRTYVATDEMQRDMDRRFGAGVVRLYGWLRPAG
ncbi:hypothetical protein ACIQMR_15580 [Streptomyces sp. NPDC091376]|uniref:hypothetical protein n=1 Tax=Streptomyces sp. NPDC091376 TaxID=3365994 RepID=UPI0038076457